MLAGLRQFLRERQGLKAFKAVPIEQRKLVLYAESEGYWTYFEPIVEA